MEENQDKQLKRIADKVAKAILEGQKAKAAASKLSAREELFRNSLGVRLKKPKD